MWDHWAPCCSWAAEEKSKAGELQPGDHVVLTAQERALLDTRWNHVYVIIQVRGHVIKIQHEQTTKVKMANRDKLWVVDPRQDSLEEGATSTRTDAATSSWEWGAEESQGDW